MDLFKRKKNETSPKTEEGGDAIKIAKRGNVADFIVDHNKGIRNIVLILVVVFAICYPFVSVNYDLTKYLPNDVDSKIAINKMREVFGYPGTGMI